MHTGIRVLFFACGVTTNMQQGLVKAMGVLMMVIGVLLGLLGLVFLLAGGDRASVGLIMLVIAAILIGLAASRLRAIEAARPESIEVELASLAAATDGEVTVAQALGHLRADELTIRQALESLVRKGVARVEMRGGTAFYKFSGTTQAKMIKKCPYCGNEYPLSSDTRTCQSCGGNLEVRPG